VALTPMGWLSWSPNGLEVACSDWRRHGAGIERRELCRVGGRLVSCGRAWAVQPRGQGPKEAQRQEFGSWPRIWSVTYLHLAALSRRGQG